MLGKVYDVNKVIANGHSSNALNLLRKINVYLVDGSFEDPGVGYITLRSIIENICPVVSLPQTVEQFMRSSESSFKQIYWGRMFD